MSATTSGSVVETIRQQLAAGCSADQVVDGLMAGGLSRHSAERFVQRAGGQVTMVVPPPIPAVAAAVEPPPLPGMTVAAEPTPSADAYATMPPPVPGAMVPPSVPGAPVARRASATPANLFKLAGGAALLLVGVGLLALSLSASGRVRLKLPVALVLSGGATLVQAIRER